MRPTVTRETFNRTPFTLARLIRTSRIPFPHRYDDDSSLLVAHHFVFTANINKPVNTMVNTKQKVSKATCARVTKTMISRKMGFKHMLHLNTSTLTTQQQLALDKNKTAYITLDMLPIFFTSFGKCDPQKILGCGDLIDSCPPIVAIDRMVRRQSEMRAW